MYTFKDSVKVAHVKPEVVAALMCVAGVYIRSGYNCVVTSITDGIHSAKSKHYSGYAVDFRTRDISRAEIIELANAIREALTVEFDVVIEKTHIHVEYDPVYR